MHRALAILKYVPAALCALLVVAWVVSLFVCVTTSVRLPQGSVALSAYRGSICVSHYPSTAITRAPVLRRLERREMANNGTLGTILNQSYIESLTREEITLQRFPIPVLLTLLLPFTIGPFLRFPLWSYFAWTALLAVELAYYLG